MRVIDHFRNYVVFLKKDKTIMKSFLGDLNPENKPTPTEERQSHFGMSEEVYFETCREFDIKWEQNKQRYSPKPETNA